MDVCSYLSQTERASKRRLSEIEAPEPANFKELSKAKFTPHPLAPKTLPMKPPGG